MKISKGTRTYKGSGVNIEFGMRFITMISKIVQAAWNDAENPIGGFAGSGDIPPGANKLDASADGTGEKIILAALVEYFQNIGQDAVAMAVVDLYVNGSLPAYITDVLDVAKLDPELHIQIIESIIRACHLAGCRLIGGETAEMPHLFKRDWIVNLNVSAIGFPSPELAYSQIKEGQLVYGLRSLGPASNGFSLIYDVFGLDCRPGKARQRLRAPQKKLGGQSLADALLLPTPIWIKHLEADRKRGVIYSGMAHITGGGMYDNIPRMLTPEFKVVINRGAWPRPPIFPLIQRRGKIAGDEMDAIFNQGLMIIYIVDSKGDLPSAVPKMNSALLIGRVEKRNGDEPQVRLTGNYNDSR